MTDVASLVMKVDATSVKDADKALGDLEKQAGQTEQSAAAMGRTFGTVLGAAAVAAASAIAYATKSAIDAADAMNDLHLKTGLSLRDLAAYDELARQSGTTVNAVAQGFKFLSKYMVEHSDKLQSLGVTSTDTNEAMRQFADVIAGIEDPALRSTLAQEVLGRSATELLPALVSGKAGLDAVSASTTEYGKALEKAAPLADAFNDKLAIIATQAKTAGLSLANEFLPFLDQTASEFIRIQKESGTFLAIMSSIGKITLQGLGFETDPQKRAVAGLNDMMKEHRDLLDEIARRRASGAETATLKQREKDLRAAIKAQIDLVNAPLAGAVGVDKPSASGATEKAARDLLKSGKGKAAVDALTKEQRDLQQSALEAQRIIFATDPIAAASAEWEKLIALKEKGLLTDKQIADFYAQTYGKEDVAAAEKSAKAMADANEKEAKRAQQAWENFTGNVQRNLGDVLYQGLTGGFKNIGDAFKQMLLRMSADAAAAQLTQAMFSSEKGGGALGKLGGMIGDFFAPSFAGGGFTGNGTRSGGVDGMGGFPAILHPNETVVDHTKGQAAAPSVTVVQNITIDSRTDSASIMAMMSLAKDMAKAEIMNSIMRGGDFARATGRA